MSTNRIKSGRAKVSVALALYNGAKFIEDQLASISQQCRLPDEVIIFDDGSTDGSPELVNNFKHSAPFPLSLIGGKGNVGVNSAFGAAVEACNGDIVFFCDQDDVWEPSKVSRMMEVFEQRSDVGFVFCDASQIDIDGEAIPGSLWEQIGFTSGRRQAFCVDPLGEMLSGGNVVYGMSAAFRLNTIRPFLPITASPKDLTHDTWFALHAAATGWGAVAIDECLVRYRRHEHQATKAASRHMREAGKEAKNEVRNRYILGETRGLLEVYENLARLIAGAPENKISANLFEIYQKIDFLKRRLDVRSGRKFSALLHPSAFPGYYRYASGLRSILKDISGL